MPRKDMFTSLSACPSAVTGQPTPSTYQVLPPAIAPEYAPANTATATAFHQQAQAALPAGCRVTTYGDSHGHVSAIVYDASGKELAYCAGCAAEVLAQIEAQRAALAHLSR